MRCGVVSEGFIVDFVGVVSGEYIARLAPTFEKGKKVARKRRVESV